MTNADLRALLREAARAYAPLGAYDPTLRDRLWAAYDALATGEVTDPGIPETSRDARRDHDRHPARPL